MAELTIPITKTYVNQSAAAVHQGSGGDSHERSAAAAAIDPLIRAFHRGLAQYKATPLVSLPDIAAELGVGHLFIKLEASRFGLPSFKILGASWAIFRLVAERVGLLAAAASVDEIAAAAQQKRLRLVACTDGNWGRAVARMAQRFGIPAVVYVPQDIDEVTRDKIRSEASNVRCEEVSGGDYDDAIRRAVRESEQSKENVLVLDTSWEGYERFPNWVKEGYTTMLVETDEQIAYALDHWKDTKPQTRPTVVIASVGVGSWAHAVVEYYKTDDSGGHTATKVITVEPETAASLLTSLHHGRIMPIKTKSTIMNGMNCGSTSYIAWPALRTGVDVSVAVSDLEAHQAILNIRNSEAALHDVGPCGAAPLAGLLKLVNAKDESNLKLRMDDIVVLFCTEGKRYYPIPTPMQK